MPDRRSMLKTSVGLPLTAVLSSAQLARANAGMLETVEISTASGIKVRGALATPAKTPAPAILLVHEWWGLNDQIKAVASEFAAQGYISLAVDLYNGKVATDADGARALTKSVDGEVATDTVASWLRWLKADPAGTGKVATIGWCFGGGWALNAALAEPVDATVVYYGNVKKTAQQLSSLQGPVLGHFATQDQWINADMVNGFTEEMRKAGKSLSAHWYEAKHAFANPTTARYDQADAALAWQRTLAFLKKQLS